MFPIVQSGRQPQMPTTKLRMMVLPCGVCVTSGWNCRPKMRRERSATAQCSLLELRPRSTNPGGSASSLSPWLIHT